MTRRRSSSSSIVPRGASRRAWSWPSARIPGRRRTSASARATAGPGATFQAPPAAIATSGAGAASIHGVASSRRRTAARVAASRSSAPSPAASPHGVTASSRRRSRTRSRSSGIVSHALIASRCASPNARGRSAASAIVAVATVEPAAGGRRGLDPHAGRLPDVDELEPPAEHVGERPEPGPERPPAVRLAAAQRGQQLAQRGATGVPGRGAEERRARTSGRDRDLVPAAGRGEAAGQDDREVGTALGGRGEDGGQLRHQRPLVGRRAGRRSRPARR